MQRRNAPACLLMAVAQKVAGHLELLMQAGGLFRQLVANRLQLKADPGEALRECVVYFVSRAAALIEYGSKPASVPLSDTGSSPVRAAKPQSPLR